MQCQSTRFIWQKETTPKTTSAGAANSKTTKVRLRAYVTKLGSNIYLCLAAIALGTGIVLGEDTDVEFRQQGGRTGKRVIQNSEERNLTKENREFRRQQQL
ncbi:hypothetical protein EV426DRAFT_578199 [Tirmania nivea]|nr:hypothetical protein EV426DRAFT_578199 [Tirmania nivea]